MLVWSGMGLFKPEGRERGWCPARKGEGGAGAGNAGHQHVHVGVVAGIASRRQQAVEGGRRAVVAVVLAVQSSRTRERNRLEGPASDARETRTIGVCAVLPGPGL